MPCTTDCGCTSTPIRLLVEAEQPRRLDQLEALVEHGGGVDADLRAHRPDRVPQRRLGRRARHLVEAGACGTGRRRRSARCARPRRDCPRPCAWKIALCSESTGSSVAPASRTARSITSPAQTSASLLASAIAPPRRIAASVVGRPAAPVIAAMVQSAGSAGRFHHRLRPARGGDAAAGSACSSAGVAGRVGDDGEFGAAAGAPARPAARRCGRRPGRGRGSGPDWRRAGRPCSGRRCRCCPGRSRYARLLPKQSSLSHHHGQCRRQRGRREQPVQPVQQAAMARDQIARSP